MGKEKQILDYHGPQRRRRLSIAHYGLACATFVFVLFSSVVIRGRLSGPFLSHYLFISTPLSLLSFCLVCLGDSPRLALWTIALLVIAYAILIVGVPRWVPA